MPPDLAVPLSSLLAAVTRARAALRAADPIGQLWAACVTFVQQAQRFGVAAPNTRRVRAQRERRLGELAEQAGDLSGAILHYRAAIASHARVGVRRRLAQLDAATAVARPGRAPRRDGGPRRRSGARRPAPPAARTDPTRPPRSVQLACRIDPGLHATVRAQAARAGQTLRAFVLRALEQVTVRRSTRRR